MANCPPVFGRRSTQSGDGGGANSLKNWRADTIRLASAVDGLAPELAVNAIDRLPDTVPDLHRFASNSHCVPNRIVRPVRIAVGFIQVRVAGFAP